MKRNFLPAFALCGAMLVNTLPVSAAYTSPDEIALRIDGCDPSAAPEIPGYQYVTTQMAREGTTLHFGVFIEAERAEFSIIGLKIQSDSEDIRFVQDTLASPMTPVGEEPVSHYLTDGTEYVTNLRPYCLGKLVGDGGYSANCFSCNLNADAEGNALTVYWMHGIGQVEEFLDPPSDTLSFVEFDVEVAVGIEPGAYHLDFITAEDAQTAEYEKLTYVVSDNGTQAVSEYHNIIPTLKGVTIVVEDQEELRGDATDNGEIDAGDAAQVLMYAAASGSGENPSIAADILNEMRVRRQANVNQDSTIDASDAAAILQYAAAKGSGTDVTWEEILGA